MTVAVLLAATGVTALAVPAVEVALRTADGADLATVGVREEPVTGAAAGAGFASAPAGAARAAGAWATGETLDPPPQAASTNAALAVTGTANILVGFFWVSIESPIRDVRPRHPARDGRMQRCT